MNAHSKAHQIASEIGKPENAAMIERQLLAKDPTLRAAHDANRAAIKNALPCGIAGPRGCNVCCNTVVVRGYDCWACETAFDTDVRDTSALASAIGRALASAIGRALELQMDAERGS